MCLVSSLWFSFFAKLFEIQKKILIFKNLNMPNVFLSLSFMPYGTTQTCFFKLIQIMFYRIFKILDALKPVHPPTQGDYLWPSDRSDLGQTNKLGTTMSLSNETIKKVEPKYMKHLLMTFSEEYTNLNS